MKLLLLFATALLLLFAGCIKTSANGTAGIGQTEQQKQPAVNLGISKSDLQVDDPGLDPTTDEFEDLGRP